MSLVSITSQPSCEKSSYPRGYGALGINDKTDRFAWIMHHPSEFTDVYVHTINNPEEYPYNLIKELPICNWEG